MPCGHLRTWIAFAAGLSLAALARPVFGDWSVTLVLVAATVGVILATFWAFPELRQGWWAVAVPVQPALAAAPRDTQANDVPWKPYRRTPCSRASATGIAYVDTCMGKSR